MMRSVVKLFVTVHWLRTSETAPYTSFIPLSIGGSLLAFLLKSPPTPRPMNSGT